MDILAIPREGGYGSIGIDLVYCFWVLHVSHVFASWVVCYDLCCFGAGGGFVYTMNGMTRRHLIDELQ